MAHAPPPPPPQTPELPELPRPFSAPPPVPGPLMPPALPTVRPADADIRSDENPAAADSVPLGVDDDVRAFGTSFAVHVVVLLALALLVMPRPEFIEPLAIDMGVVDENLAEDPLAEAIMEPEAMEAAVEEQEDREAVAADSLVVLDLPPKEVVGIELADLEAADLGSFAEDTIGDASALLTEVDVGPESGRRGGVGGRGRGGGGGGRGELGRRLKAAGAGSGDVQVSILWNTIDDIDLHVRLFPSLPSRRPVHLAFFERRGPFGGLLDVDRNASPPLTRKPVENIFWPKGKGVPGRYEVYVHHYRAWGGPQPTDVVATVSAGGEQRTFDVSVAAGDPPRLVVEFELTKSGSVRWK